MKKSFFKVAGGIFFICVLSVFISGCATLTGGSTADTRQGGVAMAKILKFDDIPVPAGFRMLNNESFTFQNDQMRVGLLKYAGVPDANKVVEFYKEQMPTYNWDLVNVIEYGQRIMNFERPGQSCIVTIQPEATRTVIAIAVAPKSSTPMTTEKVTKYKELKEDYLEPMGAK